MRSTGRPGRPGLPGRVQAEQLDDYWTTVGPITVGSPPVLARVPTLFPSENMPSHTNVI